MVDLVNIPAIDEVTDVSDLRIVLYQSGRLIHAPLQQVIDAVINGSGIVLEGDEGGSSAILLLLEGDESGTLLLN